MPGLSWHDLDAIDASYIENQARLDTLTVFLEHPAISLCTLNAPHQKHLYGVTPLGITAWLNVPDAVDVLLESEDGKILVDGADAYGATPLMCTFSLFLLRCLANTNLLDAARDGNLEVLQRLVRRFAQHVAKKPFINVHLSFITVPSQTSVTRITERRFNLRRVQNPRYYGCVKRPFDLAGRRIHR